jgi:hypothetical protein
LCTRSVSLPILEEISEEAGDHLLLLLLLRQVAAFVRVLIAEKSAGFGFPVAVRTGQSPATECSVGKP